MRPTIALTILLTLVACRTDPKPEHTDTPPELTDADGDGYDACVDCDDDDPEIHPDAAEICDGIDNDCDGEADEDLLIDLWADRDGDGYGDPDGHSQGCEPAVVLVDDFFDCDVEDAEINPGADELCYGIDDDCDGETDEGVLLTLYQDADGDGWGDSELTMEACEPSSGWVLEGGDCDDGDPAYHPEATEDDCTDPADYDCDGSTAWADDDGDGWAACEECDDGDPEVNPGVAELCDGIDNDCDGSVDEDDASDADTWYADSDGDGYGDADATTAACTQPTGYSADATDCDDASSAVNPGAPELCNGIDDDCDGVTDEDDASDAPTWYADRDADGYGDPATSTAACSEPSGFSADATDCDDTDADVNPGASEACNGIDDDCDGSVDEDDASDASTWYADSDGDGYGEASDAVSSCEQPTGYVADDSDCDDTTAAVNPGATETCNSVDDDCDGSVDEDDASDASTWYADDDLDGYGDPADSTTACSEPSGYTWDDSDCDDSDGTVNPSETETCNGVDDDCDGSVDEDDASDAQLWYPDADLDGYGDPSGTPVESCSEPSGYTDDDTDCDDGDAASNPGASELCDGADNDCDGTVDEGHDADGDGITDCEEIEYEVDFILSADDNWEGYMDETYLGSYGGWSTSNTFTSTMDSGTHALAVYGWDSGAAIAGFIAAVVIDGTTEYVTGDGSWVMVDNTTDADWYTIDYDDSAWGTPSACSSSSVSYYWGSNPSDLTGMGAAWVWHTSCTSLGNSYYRLVFELP